MPKGYRGGYNPFRDAHGRYATQQNHGARLMNAAIRQAAGRQVRPEVRMPDPRGPLMFYERQYQQLAAATDLDRAPLTAARLEDEDLGATRISSGRGYGGPGIPIPAGYLIPAGYDAYGIGHGPQAGQMYEVPASMRDASPLWRNFGLARTRRLRGVPEDEVPPQRLPLVVSGDSEGGAVPKQWDRPALLALNAVRRVMPELDDAGASAELQRRLSAAKGRQFAFELPLGETTIEANYANFNNHYQQPATGRKNRNQQ